MPNEIKTMSPEIVSDKDKPTFDLPVLTVDKDDVLPTEKQDQEAVWHELKNAYINTLSVALFNQIVSVGLTHVVYAANFLRCYNYIPKLSKGQTILSIQSSRNIAFNIDCTEQELELFRGGA